MSNLKRNDYSEISMQLEMVVTRLNVIINLLLDILPDDKFGEPRKLTHKVARLDSTGIVLRPTEMGGMLGRPSKDISSRRREYKATAVKRQKRSSLKGKSQIEPTESSKE